MYFEQFVLAMQWLGNHETATVWLAQRMQCDKNATVYQSSVENIGAMQ